ncbi:MULTISPECIES: competence/damage-inducible protein A [Halolamina]|uniref:Molybdenum cofactor synthesis domain-containing protein n=1 Tax=Halolamina pelagica TaxID=699431 RepID=A0A1I5NXY3_9EURY|nr:MULTISPECIES: molybdopterin-binding protein [Halolamina]NHX36530.1 competence/damage-inducible protein A [Halolamina sp. R1-12]SFP26607.1 molybdenum cofactor synthesis domain-containing protein [Halolamina pelagica]
MDAAIVTVGDELLTGDTENTNATWLCARLDDRGVDVERVTTVPDRVADIARVVNEYHAEYDAVLVTGGLGPTHDDVTMEGVAAAFGREVELDDAAAEWLQEEGYASEDLVTGTAELPAGARPLHNTEGVAPGAVVESCYVFPGVPAEMQAMFASVADEFDGEQTYIERVEAAEPESALLDRLAEVQDRFGVTVGSYPGETVTLKVTATDPEAAREAAAWLTDHVQQVDESAE